MSEDAGFYSKVAEEQSEPYIAVRPAALGICAIVLGICGIFYTDRAEAPGEATKTPWIELSREDSAGLSGALSKSKGQRSSDAAPYSKEFGLLAYVLAHARSGDPAASCDTMERYAEEELRHGSTWLKIAGGAKADLLAVAMRRAPSGGNVLEIGTYCGYSSMRLAIALPFNGPTITTIEVDPVHVLISRRMHAYAGLDQIICVLTGHSKDLLPRMAVGLGFPGFGAVFMDHRGSRKEIDLAFLERSSMMLKNAVVIADNVLKPGAPLFLWRVIKGGRYDSQVVRLAEFAMPSEDWVSISTWLGGGEMNPEPIPDPPPEIRELDKETDRMCERATRSGRGVSFQEWAAFAARMRHELEQVGIHATHETHDFQQELLIPAKELIWNEVLKYAGVWGTPGAPGSAPGIRWAPGTIPGTPYGIKASS